MGLYGCVIGLHTNYYATEPLDYWTTICSSLLQNCNKLAKEYDPFWVIIDGYLAKCSGITQELLNPLVITQLNAVT